MGSPSLLVFLTALIWITLCWAHSNWKIFDPDQEESVEKFLALWPPSQVPKSEYAWIYVPGSQGTIDAGDVHGLMAEWNHLDSIGACTQQMLNKLAEKYNVVSGKWMIYLKSFEVDEGWNRIARAVTSGDVGVAAKVEPYSPTEINHCICVYASNIFDHKEVRDLRQHLRQMGFDKVLEFKPDAYTHVGIYPGNKWNIPEGMYRE
uniref:DUF1917 domain-containing protein n=1 Tax=Spongospora subterranea TaxID=70186 RepID=A0A0H5RSY0_9EUKA|eukprot:CRZ11829.1 hypothetical protein [Spongospora subterranea]